MVPGPGGYLVVSLIRSCLLITLIKCLKGHKSLGSLCSVVKTLIVSGNIGTMSPIELFWTAKNMKWTENKLKKNEMDNKSELNTIATHQKLLYINIHFASVASLTEIT